MRCLFLFWTDADFAWLGVLAVSCSEVEVEEAAAEVVKDTVAAVKVRLSP